MFGLWIFLSSRRFSFARIAIGTLSSMALSLTDNVDYRGNQIKKAEVNIIKQGK